MCHLTKGKDASIGSTAATCFFKKGALVMESGFTFHCREPLPLPMGLSVQDELIPLSYHIHIPERVKFGNV